MTPFITTHEPPSKAPCSHMVQTLAPKYLCRNPFKLKVYTIWVHGALGVSDRFSLVTLAACACLGLARMQSTRWLSAKPEDVAPEAYSTVLSIGLRVGVES